MIAALTVGTLAAVVQDAHACHRRGGGCARRIAPSYGGYRSQNYGYTPVYSQPTYAQPSFSQPAYSQPGQFPQQNIQTQPGAQPRQQLVVPQNRAPQTPVQQISQQPSVAPQQTVVPRQNVTPQQTPAPQTAQAPTTNSTAQMSALQALGGFAPPQTPASVQLQTPTPVHVGTWTATLGNGASVKLTLQSNGGFNWVATNKSGTASSFAGSYSVTNGSLALNRSNDNQQLVGSMTNSGTNAFSFKVAGNNSAAINFNRS
jgi:hypothetical protein